RTIIDNNGENNIKEPELENIINETNLKEQIAKFEKRGKTLFDKGDYLEALKLFKKTENNLLKINRKKEALIFSRKYDQIKKLIDQRKETLKLLTGAKINKDIIEVINLYNEIIEISKELNDIDGLAMYRVKLSQFTNSNEISIPELELKMMVLEEQAAKCEKEYLYGAASDNYEQCEKICLLLMQLGNKEEENNLVRFREKKETLRSIISKRE
ncbi:MAG: hypothetical protein ACFFDN_12365, partial [Candidatus Hodarchaeota archaeon]